MPSFELEVAGFTIALAYCLFKQLPFSAYGELVFILLQCNASNSTHPEESLCQKASDPVLLCNQRARKSAVCLCTESLELLKKSAKKS